MSAELGRVSDSGEACWTANATIDERVHTPELATALSSRLRSRNLVFGNHVLSALRRHCRGHEEKPAR